MEFTFKLDLKVDAPDALYEQARARAIDEGTPADRVDEILKSGGGAIDARACIQMLLDPGSLAGCSIHGGSVELVDAASVEEEEPDHPMVVER